MPNPWLENNISSRKTIAIRGHTVYLLPTLQRYGGLIKIFTQSGANIPIILQGGRAFNANLHSYQQANSRIDWEDPRKKGGLLVVDRLLSSHLALHVPPIREVCNAVSLSPLHQITRQVE